MFCSGENHLYDGRKVGFFLLLKFKVIFLRHWLKDLLELKIQGSFFFFFLQIFLNRMQAILSWNYKVTLWEISFSAIEISQTQTFCKEMPLQIYKVLLQIYTPYKYDNITENKLLVEILLNKKKKFFFCTNVLWVLLYIERTVWYYMETLSKFFFFK